MAKNFDEIPSEIELALEVPQEPTVADELQATQQLLQQRATKCKNIKPLYKEPHKKPPTYAYKFLCVCQRYNPQYACKHSGNIVIDRDVLTREEHLCYLAAPKENLAAPRKQPRFYQKKTVVPNCTSRIEKLAEPDVKRVKETLQNYKHILTKRHRKALRRQLEKKPEVQYTSINTALAYIEEERRLRHVAKMLEKRRCTHLRKRILHKQRRQIRKIISVLFEEMKDFLLNDQFLMDERSTLCAVILDQIKNFTEREFHMTSNLREYQKILANNLAVWINKFISNLNIQVAPAAPQQGTQRSTEADSFLPVADYIPCSESSEEACLDEDYTDFGEEGEDDFGFYDKTGPLTTDDNTIRNTNP